MGGCIVASLHCFGSLVICKLPITCGLLAARLRGWVSEYHPFTCSCVCSAGFAFGARTCHREGASHYHQHHPPTPPHPHSACLPLTQETRRVAQGCRCGAAALRPPLWAAAPPCLPAPCQRAWISCLWTWLPALARCRPCRWAGLPAACCRSVRRWALLASLRPCQEPTSRLR